MTIGWEILFEDYLAEAYGDGAISNFKEVRKSFPHAELICPACRRVYSLDNCLRCEAPLNIKHEKAVVRIVCANCDVSYDRPTNKCKNDGSELIYFLVGNEMTLLRPYGLLLFSDEDAWRTTGFYKEVCDISNVLPPLHYLADEKKFLDRRVLDATTLKSGLYLWKKTNLGTEFEKELFESVFKPAGLLKPIKDFVQIKIENGLEKNAELVNVDVSSLSVFLPSEGRGEVKKKKGTFIIQHVRG